MESVISKRFEVDGDNFIAAGQTSSAVKRMLKQLGVDSNVIRRVAIAMYEGEINMVIHANGGYIDIIITPEQIKIILTDNGPGIPDVDAAMKEGYSTASEQIRELGFGAGMGLPNMKKYTDDMKITTEIGKGTTIELTINTK